MARRARPLLLPLLAALALVPRLAAQSPTRFLVCESRDNACAQPSAALDQTWTFNGTEGTAGGSAGPASLSIQKFDSTALVVQRTDSSGLTALYSGAVQGARVRGTVQWSWPGHAGYPASGIFSAVLQDSVAQDSPAAPTAAGGTGALSLPPQLLVCENQGPPCNAAWSFHGTEGTAVWFDQNHTHAHLTLVRAEPDYLVIRRTDTNSSNTAVYTGSLRGDRYVGTIVYSSPGHPGDRTGSWTGTVPTFHCDPHDDLSRQEATTLGQTALMFHHGSEAMACYTLAANDGDVTAERVVGLLYYQGSADVPQDYAQALHWLQRAADQGVYQAQRLVSEMYAAGQGTQPNPALAKIYAERADEQKHDFERQQDLAEREADRRTQVLSSFVLGASFGLFW